MVELRSIGYTIDGEKKEYSSRLCNIQSKLYAPRDNLVSLEIAEGIAIVKCWNNPIEELVLPDSVRILTCDKQVKGLEKYIGKVKMELW